MKKLTKENKTEKLPLSKRVNSVESPRGKAFGDRLVKGMVSNLNREAMLKSLNKK